MQNITDWYLTHDDFKMIIILAEPHPHQPDNYSMETNQ